MTGGRLAERVCIVTGAGSQGPGIGNGRAVAIVFAREGGKVLVVDRDEAAADATAKMIEKEGGCCAVHPADVTDAAQCEAMVAAAVARWGRLDVLHNNVGIDEGPASVVDVPEESWDRVMSVNVKSILLTGKYAVPAMVEAGGGSIVNISSISALRPRHLTTYTASKGAVIALTQAMAVDHGPAGIRVNCIAPGPVYTPMVSAAGMSAERREQRRMASVLQIEGTGWDIANAALFLASDEARYITGVVLPVDGGTILRGPDR